MGYWEKRPLKVEPTDKLKTIMSDQELLELVYLDLDSNKFTVEWEVYHPAKNPIPIEIKFQLLNFINDNYLGDLDHKMIYSPDLFDYFTIDSLIILAYDSQKKI